MNDEQKNMAYAQSLAKMLRVPTVTDSGKANFVELQRVMKEIAPRFFGLETAYPRNSALIVKWTGKSHDKPLVLMGHQDVVPAEDETKWKYPPYAGTIAEGKLWGRGALDCKGHVFAAMQAAEELLAEGFVPEQDVYFCFGDDEENAGGGAVAEALYLKSKGVKPALVLDEGGGMITKEMLPKLMIENIGVMGVCEKGYGDFRFIASSHGGHSSTPPENTPFSRLAKLINYLEKHRLFKKKCLPVVKKMFRDAAKGVKPALRPIIRHANLLTPLVRIFAPSLAPQLEALYQTTMVFTMAEGSHAGNNIPDAAWVQANLRFAPWDSYEDCLIKLRKVAKKFDVTVEVIEKNVRNATVISDTKSDEYRFALAMIDETYGKTAIGPYLIAGGTDCRYMQEICPTALRFTPYLVTFDEFRCCHAPNERVQIESIGGAVRFFKNVITNFGK